MNTDPYITESEMIVNKPSENFETPVEERERNIGYEPNPMNKNLVLKKSKGHIKNLSNII
jgi:hypothetical protein